MSQLIEYLEEYFITMDHDYESKALSKVIQEIIDNYYGNKGEIDNSYQGVTSRFFLKKFTENDKDLVEFKLCRIQGFYRLIESKHKRKDTLSF